MDDVGNPGHHVYRWNIELQWWQSLLPRLWERVSNRWANKTCKSCHENLLPIEDMKPITRTKIDQNSNFPKILSNSGLVSSLTWVNPGGQGPRRKRYLWPAEELIRSSISKLREYSSWGKESVGIIVNKGIIHADIGTHGELFHRSNYERVLEILQGHPPTETKILAKRMPSCLFWDPYQMRMSGRGNGLGRQISGKSRF